MLLIGFVWIFVGMAALVLAKPLAPGRWEDTGPAAMMTACLGSFLGGSMGVLAVEGPNGYGPPTSAATLGRVLSIVGGVIGFGAYVVDARRQARARAS
jgi:hypothetical protein